jgi:hypothetical protein
MARYVSLHTLACLTRQGAEEVGRKLTAAPGVTVRRLLWNMTEGKLLAEFEAPDRPALERWLESQGVHYELLMRIEYETGGDRLIPL